MRKGDTRAGEMATNCPNCGTENPDHAFYCGKCARELRASTATLQVQEIEIGQSRAFEAGSFLPFPSKNSLKQATEIRKALEDEMRARGLEIPVRVKVFASIIVFSMLAGILLTVLSVPLVPPWGKPVLPSCFLGVGLSMIVAAIAFMLVMVPVRARRSAL